MTNKEKAKEIYCEHCLNKGWDKCKETCRGYRISVLKMQEMAEWKESDLFQWIQDNFKNYFNVENTDYGCFDWYINWEKMINDYKNQNKQIKEL